VSLVLLAAGGTGGHLFAAEALAEALSRRGIAVALATDHRAERYGKTFPARDIHVIASATVRGRNPLSLARTAAVLGIGTMQGLRLLARTRPSAVVGFGGYPTIPPVLAATLRKIPTVIHEQNAVIGRANRFLAPRVTAIATSFAGVLDREEKLNAKATRTGNPVRPAVIAAAASPYIPPETTGPIRLVVFGGSQGARIMADIVPPAVERLARHLQARFAVVQQAREEDLARVMDIYARAKVAADVAPFFAARARPGSIRQCRRARAGGRGDAPAAGRFHARSAGGRNQRACQRAAKARSNGRGRPLAGRHRRRRAAGGFGAARGNNGMRLHPIAPDRI